MIDRVSRGQLVIWRMIRTRKAFPGDRIHRSHRVSKRSQIPVDYLGMLLAMRNLTQPWSPFSSERDFNLGSWFVQSKVAKTRIDDYFGKSLGGMECGSFHSAYSFNKQLETLVLFRAYLAWIEATLESGEQSTIFYYPTIISCVRYLSPQVAYKEHMVYSPIRKYDSNGD